MRCSHCGLCCTETEMLLSETDVERLIKNGFEEKQFVRRDKKGYLRLRNRQRYCTFYDARLRRCRVYRRRPEGCRLYPVIYSVEDGVIVDDLCLVKDTISRDELKLKGRKVVKLLARIDLEATKHMTSVLAPP
jgi:Fe-S-cluster containining protein